jgi:hypothetical protein
MEESEIEAASTAASAQSTAWDDPSFVSLCVEFERCLLRLQKTQKNDEHSLREYSAHLTEFLRVALAKSIKLAPPQVSFENEKIHDDAKRAHALELVRLF